MTGDRADKPGTPRVGAVLLCALLSVLLHVLVVWLLLQMPRQEMFARPSLQTVQHAARYLQVYRGEARQPEPPPEAQARQNEQEEKRERPFAKTNPDAPQRRALEAEYVGARHTTAASAPDAAALRDEREAPAMEGLKLEDGRIEILQQERQDGEIESEKRASPHPRSLATALAGLSTAVVPPAPLPAAGRPEGSGAGELSGEQQETRSGTGTASVRKLESEPDGQLKIVQLRENSTPDEQEAHQARQGTPEGEADVAQPPPPVPPVDARPDTVSPDRGARPQRQPVYDPSLPAHMQPGFRTYERRSRSTGTFVMGRNPALNVEATPRGSYEALLYRLIARSWYRACDEHRSDIIPGTLTIGVCLNKQGRIHNLQLYARRGASVLQQSFTFTAIRRAALPPMPAAVRKELDSDLLEMLITFHFD